MEQDGRSKIHEAKITELAEILNRDKGSHP